MIRRDAEFLCRATGGSIVLGQNVAFSTVSIDTRTMVPNSVFFCLEGPNFDGHEFVSTAVAAGASILVVKADKFGALAVTSSDDVTVIAVENPELALAQGAAAWRRQHELTVVGLTGSSGKTTTKEMVAAVLRTHGATLATQGNLNNHLGVPLTLFRLTAEHKFAVIEMGMNAPGEIEALTGLAQPQLGVLTTIGEAHTEGVGSLAGVARAKAELLRALAPDQWAVMPSGLPHDDILHTDVDAEIATVGTEPGSIIQILHSEEGPNGAFGTVKIADVEYDLSIRLSGRHNFWNAALALAVGLKCGVNSAGAVVALQGVVPPRLRGEIRHLDDGSEVVLDCYNANPQSMRAAVTTFVDRNPNGVLALGDMLELGNDSPSAHRDLGHFVAENADSADLIGIGELSRHTVDGAVVAGLPAQNTHWVAQAADAVNLVSASCAQGRALLLKGSRGMRLEQIWDALAQMGRP